MIYQIKNHESKTQCYKQIQQLKNPTKFLGGITYVLKQDGPNMIQIQDVNQLNQELVNHNKKHWKVISFLSLQTYVVTNKQLCSSKTTSKQLCSSSIYST